MRDIFEGLEVLERVQKLLLGYVNAGMNMEDAIELVDLQSQNLNGFKLLK